jgi:hypothetical protein
VQRGGSARSFHVEGVRVADIAPIIRANIARETAMMTDEAIYYNEVGREFTVHGRVNHSKGEWARYTQFAGKPYTVHTNTVEGYYSIFKRGMKGIYQHCSEKHLHRYLAEFDFRYSHRVKLGYRDTERTAKALQGIVGKS